MFQRFGVSFVLVLLFWVIKSDEGYASRIFSKLPDGLYTILDPAKSSTDLERLNPVKLNSYGGATGSRVPVIQLAENNSLLNPETIESLFGYWIVDEELDKHHYSYNPLTFLIGGKEMIGYTGATWEFKLNETNLSIIIPYRNLTFEKAVVRNGKLSAIVIREKLQDGRSLMEQVKLEVTLKNGTFSGVLELPNQRMNVEGRLSPYLLASRRRADQIERELRETRESNWELTEKIQKAPSPLKVQQSINEVDRLNAAVEDLSNQAKLLTKKNNQAKAENKEMRGQLSRLMKRLEKQESSRKSGRDPPELTKMSVTIPVNLTVTVLETSRVRAKPSIRSPILDTLKAGQSLRATGLTADQKWYKISTGRMSGFIFSKLVKIAEAGSKEKNPADDAEKDLPKLQLDQNVSKLLDDMGSTKESKRKEAPLQKTPSYPLTFKSPASRINHILVGPDGKQIFTATNKSKIAILNIESGKVIGYLEGHSGPVRAMAISRDGNLIASGSDDNNVRLWNTRTRKQILSLEGHTGSISSLSFSGDGTFLLSGSRDKTIRVWNWKAGSLINTITLHQGPVSAIIPLPGGKLVYSASSDKKDKYEITVWELKSGRRITKMKGHRGPILTMALSPDGQFVASGSRDRTIRLWDVKNHKFHKAYGVIDGHKKSIRSIAFLHGNKRMISGSDDNSIIMWDLDSKKIIKTFVGHKRRISAVSAVDKENLIVSGAGDKFVKVWKLDN